MNRRLQALIRASVTAMLALALLPLAQGQAVDHPKRRMGLWEIRSTNAQAAGLAPTQFCVGETTDNSDTHLDRTAAYRGSCVMGAFRRVGDAWVAESVCKEGKTNITSKSIASGDFETEYRIDTQVTYDPPLGGARREDKEAVVGRHVGPCPPGQRAGDMTIPGLGVLNMNDGTLKSEPAAAPRRRQRTP